MDRYIPHTCGTVAQTMARLRNGQKSCAGVMLRSCHVFSSLTFQVKRKLRCRIGCERCETQLLIQCGHFTSAYTGKVSQVQINIFSLALCLASWGFPGGSVVKNSPASRGDVGSIPGPERSLGEGNGNPLQYSCLENSNGQRILAGYSPWGCKESDTTNTHTAKHSLFFFSLFFSLSPGWKQFVIFIDTT